MRVNTRKGREPGNEAVMANEQKYQHIRDHVHIHVHVYAMLSCCLH